MSESCELCGWVERRSLEKKQINISIKSRIVVIVGTTASGKSDLAIRLAKKFNGEIISADSRQVYCGMDIGTGKVLRDKTFPVPKSKIKSQKSKIKDFYSEGILHYLIDIASPKRQFTVSDFKRLGEKAIKEILNKGKLPIIVGGTGFYVDALVKNLEIPEVKPNKKLRQQLEKKSTEELFKQLSTLDPLRSKSIESKNKRRLIRALEIVITTGQPVPQLKTENYKLETNYDILWLGLTFPKKILEKRIKLRLDKRLRQGMVKEVEKLRRQGVSWKRLYDFGLEYRWISQYLQGRISKEEMKNGLFWAIVKYSKRQMTWFKRNKKIRWIKSFKETLELVKFELAQKGG